MAPTTPRSAAAQPQGLRELAEFPLVEALFGRRSRRFALGDEIPDGSLAYRSEHEPIPLSELERMLVLSAMGGTTGWHYSITRHARYAPHVSNYAAGAAGRTFPSAAGFHTAELFFTDDSGVWFFPTRDAGALVDPATEEVTPELMVERHRHRLRQLADGRLYLPAEEPYLEGQNTWCVNVPGSLLVIPVADIAQHLLAILCFFAQNGYAVYDDINGRKIPGLEQFAGLVNVEKPFPLTFTEQYALTEATAELASACYAGVLLLQAMGLGGWMFDGIDRFSMLGASGNPDVPGLGFRYITDERWSTPNPTGRQGVFEAYCPPHYQDMAAAVEAFAQRKFGPGGPFHRDTPGAWTDSPGFRGGAQVHDEAFKACVALQAQYAMLDRLLQLLPPPADPVEPGRPDGWAAVERSLGTALPGDFKAFTERYGSGTVDDFLYLFNPFAAGEDGNLLAEKDRVLAAYRQTRARFPDRLPLPPFPEPGGVLPLGRTDNGDELYWVTEGHPDRWPVALMESRAALQEVHQVPVTGFLAALAANQLASRVLPEDVLGRPRHRFTPLG